MTTEILERAKVLEDQIKRCKIDLSLFDDEQYQFSIALVSRRYSQDKAYVTNYFEEFFLRKLGKTLCEERLKSLEEEFKNL